MVVARTHRIVAVIAVSGTLVLGGVASPADATPAKEASNLAVLKTTWITLPVGAQKATCQLFALDQGAVIRTGVTTMMARAQARRGMSAAAWKRVLTKYYMWACSGPGRTPR
jgi:hypothetical protein